MNTRTSIRCTGRAGEGLANSLIPRSSRYPCFPARVCAALLHTCASVQWGFSEPPENRSCPLFFTGALGRQRIGGGGLLCGGWRAGGPRSDERGYTGKCISASGGRLRPAAGARCSRTRERAAHGHPSDDLRRVQPNQAPYSISVFRSSWRFFVIFPRLGKTTVSVAKP